MAVPVALTSAKLPVLSVCEPSATCALETVPEPLSVRVSLLTPVLMVPKSVPANTLVPS